MDMDFASANCKIMKNNDKDIVINEKKRPTMEEQIEFVKGLRLRSEKNIEELRKWKAELKKELGIKD